MSLFSGIKNAKIAEGRNYMQPDAHYDLEVHRIRTGTSRKGIGYFVADFKVIGTDAPKHSPGDIVNYFTMQSSESFLANVKALCVAIYSSLEGRHVDPSVIDEAAVEALLGRPLDENGSEIADALPGTAARGVRLRCRTRGVTTRAGNPFTVHDWAPAFED